MMNELQDREGLLQEVARYVRFLALSALKDALREEMPKALDRRVYQASSGKAIRAIVQETGMSFGAVQHRWQRWLARGLMVRSSERAGRCDRVFDLEGLGLLEPPSTEHSGASRAQPA
jgi:hypothetical protein